MVTCANCSSIRGAVQAVRCLPRALRLPPSWHTPVSGLSVTSHAVNKPPSRACDADGKRKRSQTATGILDQHHQVQVERCIEERTGTQYSVLPCTHTCMTTTNRRENMSRCDDPGCQRQPTYGNKGDKRPRFCSTHKHPGMYDVIARRCEEEGCMTRAAFNFHGQKVVKFCAAHKLEGMENLKSKCCEVCTRLNCFFILNCAVPPPPPPKKMRKEPRKAYSSRLFSAGFSGGSCCIPYSGGSAR